MAADVFRDGLLLTFEFLDRADESLQIGPQPVGIELFDFGDEIVERSAGCQFC
jgi:hypothetical protein